MAYRFRLYAPTESLWDLTIYYAGSGGSNMQFVDTVEPLGVSTACYDDRNCEAEFIYITASLKSGAEIDYWRINRDDQIEDIPANGSFTVGFEVGTVTNLSVRPVLVEQTKYYASLYFDANGGNYPPDAIEDAYTIDNDQYVVIDIPYDEPTRDGYVFAGWSLEEDGSGQIRQPGGTITLWGSETGEEYTLYAVWETGGGGIHVDAGNGMEVGTVIVWDDGEWKKGTVYVWDGGWKKGV